MPGAARTKPAIRAMIMVCREGEYIQNHRNRCGLHDSGMLAIFGSFAAARMFWHT
jgi:hypothetical protein